MYLTEHIVLDFEKNKNLESSWSYKFVSQKNLNSSILYTTSLEKKFFFKKHRPKFIQKNVEYTLTHSDHTYSEFKKLSNKTSINLEILPSITDETKYTFASFLSNLEIERGKNKVISIQLNEPISKTFSTLNTEKQSFIYSKYIFKKLYLFLVRNQVKKTRVNPLERSINVNFLRKERLYTKLKYSRSPAYDIVSGGAAALLAGFIGFLISEKYGFELVDSGDRKSVV